MSIPSCWLCQGCGGLYLLSIAKGLRLSRRLTTIELLA
ncbi:hypothetical protein KUC_0715 [Vreelandella boliviensis LC1]|uniref:Uncharacterized protein n=1 Tax=Vreelandella boliviensis LC1 TaxID=1072583 RepID=A0A7U9GI95_9GAMM|nr:hypothetical protein KUC_0715 [Halomonas boliviensis LC1]